MNDVAPLPGYPEPYGLLLAVLQDGTVEWRGEMPAELPAEAMIWRPRPGGQSMGALMLHNIIAELFWFEVFALGEDVGGEDKRLLKWNEIDVDEGHWPDPPCQPLSWYCAL